MQSVYHHLLYAFSCLRCHSGQCKTDVHQTSFNLSYFFFKLGLIVLSIIVDFADSQFESIAFFILLKYIPSNFNSEIFSFLNYIYKINIFKVVTNCYTLQKFMCILTYYFFIFIIRKSFLLLFYLIEFFSKTNYYPYY